jgi:hypothetical protein
VAESGAGTIECARFMLISELPLSGHTAFAPLV